MTNRARVTEADMRRAIKAATECGLQVRECVMSPAEVRLVFGDVVGRQLPDDNPKPKPWSR